MILIVKNNTSQVQYILDLREQKVPASGQVTLIDGTTDSLYTLDQVLLSSDLKIKVNSGIFTLNNGYVDLTLNDAISVLTQSNQIINTFVNNSFSISLSGKNIYHYAEITTVTYQILNTFIYPGTNYIPLLKTLKIVAWVNSPDCGGSLRMYNPSSGQILAQVNDINNVESYQIYTTNISNLPANESVIEFQGKKSLSNFKFFISNILVS